MPKLTIAVNQQLDKVGGEFLDERDFEIEFDFSRDDNYVVCVIDDKQDCYIKRSDLLMVLALLKSSNGVDNG